jgi:hypothetical protein
MDANLVDRAWMLDPECQKTRDHPECKKNRDHSECQKTRYHPECQRTRDHPRKADSDRRGLYDPQNDRCSCRSSSGRNFSRGGE